VAPRDYPLCCSPRQRPGIERADHLSLPAESRDSSYWHLASASDDAAIKTLQARDFFKHYTEMTRQVAEGGDVVVTPIEWIAETAA
jgi:hypothetical protein